MIILAKSIQLTRIAFAKFPQAMGLCLFLQPARQSQRASPTWMKCPLPHMISLMSEKYPLDLVLSLRKFGDQEKFNRSNAM